jgi:Leucine-rich repeat (LRR) protein
MAKLNNVFIKELTRHINQMKKLKSLDISYNDFTHDNDLYNFLKTLIDNKTLKKLTIRSIGKNIVSMLPNEEYRASLI